MNEIIDILQHGAAPDAGDGGAASRGGGRGPDGDSLVAGLTEPQRRAVTTTEGPVLILAAAGSGKTRVITRRIAYLLSLGVPAWQIVALTFTNKAAGEMRDRVLSILNPGEHPRPDPGSTGDGAKPPSTERLLRGLTVTTFHSICARLLRKYAPFMEGAPAWGLKHDFSIYDGDDQASLVKRVITELGMSTSNFPPRNVLSAISKAKNDLMDARMYSEAARDFNTKSIARIFQGYERGLRAANAADFDDLLLLTVRMLKESEEARNEVQRRWRYLMIDEYQDTNKAQFVLSTFLVGRDRPDAPPNVCVVGDPDQSIYGWRGADISNILDFEETYPGAQVIPLGENFRSRAPILQAADTLIRNNKRRKHKDLFTSKAGGEKPSVVLCRDEHHEASLVVDWLKRTVTDDERVHWKDTAVFYRNNSLSRVMEDSLRASGIPYVIARGTAFYQREEVKDALAYLRVVANPADEVSLRRIINKPARKIGPAAVERLDMLARAGGMTLMDAARQPERCPELGAAAIGAVRKFTAMLDGWSGGGSFMGAELPGSLHELVSRVIKESGLEAHYKKAGEKDAEDADKLSNLEEVVSSAREFELEYDAASDPAYADEARGGGVNAEGAEGAEKQRTEGVRGGGDGGDEGVGVSFLADLARDGLLDEGVEGAEKSGEGFVPPLLAMLRAYLESVSLVADADKVDPANGAVTLMTLHAAKGLEFHAVAMIGLEEGLLPSIRAMEADGDVEEERRLCFVGITRAMEKLLITSSKYRTQRGLLERTIPSRFLSELPKGGIELSDQSGDGFGARFDEDADERPARPGGWGDGRGWGGAGRSGTAVREDGESRGAGADGRGTRRDVPFPVGSQVRHPQFGVGRVESITGIGVNTRARISFRDVGPKTLVLQYARLERVN